jgi:hypothetical protein
MRVVVRFWGDVEVVETYVGDRRKGKREQSLLINSRYAIHPSPPDPLRGLRLRSRVRDPLRHASGERGSHTKRSKGGFEPSA